MYINLDIIRDSACKIARQNNFIAVVKANAYGVGDYAVAHCLQKIVCGFAVWTEDEARQLCEAGIRQDILVLGHSHGRLNATNVVHTVFSEEELSRNSGGRIAVKLNTGMNRMGSEPKEFFEIISEAIRRGIEIDSVYSHLFCPSNEYITNYQLGLFRKCTSSLPFRRHLAASSALKSDFVAEFDAVRCGIALYENAILLAAEILVLRKVKRGEYVGYGDIPLGVDSSIAIVDIGYGDGYRRLSGERFVYLSGKKCKVLSVCMDVSIIDVSGVECDVGDVAELLGNHITPDELAESYGTNKYEVMFYHERVKKIYV